MRRLLAALLLAMAFAAPAHAVRPDEVLADPVLEARARTLSAELRCMVCQNQSIDDSDADLARDLRLLLRERLVAGDTDREVLDYLVSRYGEFVLLKPRLGLNTLVLWLAPPALLIGGAILAFVVVRRRASARPPGALTEDEEKRLAAALARSEDRGGRQ